MRVDKGQFTKKEVRQALALSLDRDALITQLFDGRADLGNDHVIAPIYPYFDDSVPQRTRDVEKAKSLLAAAGTPTISATLHAGQLLEIPDLATLLKSQAAEAGFNLEVAVESLDSFYGAQWCPRGAGRPAVLGRGRARDRRLRPPGDPGRLPQRRAQVQGHLEFVPVHVGGIRQGLRGVPGSDRGRCPEGCVQEDRDDPQRRMSDRPAVLVQLPGRKLEEVPGIYTSALGQMFLSSTSRSPDLYRSGGSRCDPSPPSETTVEDHEDRVRG